MTSALVTYTKPDEVRKDITALRAQVEEVLPSRIDADRFLRVVAKTVIENPRIMECTRLSVLAAIHEAAQLGLEPSGLLGSAYLVPFRRRVQTDGKWQTIVEARLIPGYRGLIDLARRSGEILKVEARVVRARDSFSLDYGRPQPVEHRPFIADPSAEAEERDPGPYLGAYMRALLRDDPVPQVEWMSTDEIEQVRRSSKAADDGPWVTNWSEMARKTVVRRGSKYLPLAVDFRRALELDEEAERDAVAPAPFRFSKAQQMLADRASALETALDGQHDPTPVDEPPDTENGAPDASSEPETEPPTQEASETGRPWHEPAKTSAQSICGVVGELGACTRMPDHPGGHRNEAGVWPRGK